jgi:multiple sugar transport system permease protein
MENTTNKKIHPVKIIILTFFMLIIAMYFLFPLYWLAIASTKIKSQLFTTSAFWFTEPFLLIENLKTLSVFEEYSYWRWYLNSAIIASASAIIGTLISALSGYALAKYTFRGSNLVFLAILISIMFPQAALAIPLFIILKEVELINTYFGIILPLIVNPFGIYYMTVFIRSTFPTELIDSGRVDGASDYKIFYRIALPIISPGLVTLFLIAFIGAWNNFFLPLIVLNDSLLYPLTVGLSNWNLSQYGNKPIPMEPLLLLGSLLSILPMMILFPLLKKYVISGISMGSVKS